jgi:hypothetical protein
MAVYVENAHEHVQRLFPVVKMATVLELCTTEEQRSVMRFYAQIDSMKRILIKKYFLFTVESVCRVKRFTAGLRYSLNDIRKSQMMAGRAQMW